VKLWRVSRYVDLEGKGGLYAAGRWHHKGRPVIYASEHAALAIIEFLVNIVDRALIPSDTTLYSIEMPTDTPTGMIAPGLLPADWRSRHLLTRELGTEWLDGTSEAVLQIPAATTAGHNFLINPKHPDISRFSIVDRIQPPFDRRLLR
jgi:RES domain-containing protein